MADLPIARPSTGEEEWRALKAPLESGWLTQGPQVAAFERAFGSRHSVPHALATTSCTTALHLILAGLGVGPGDEVLVPAFTWVATANVVLYCGATPIFVDVERESMNLDPTAAAAARTEHTKAAIPVHLFGRCADMDALAAALPGVALVEDAACASGAEYRGRMAGSLGAAGAFSFHPRKTITTGEGGMVTTTDPELFAQMQILRNHGASVPEEVRHHGPRPYLLPDFNLLGFNYRMSDLQGAVGRVQLGKLNRLLEGRSALVAAYAEQLGHLDWLRLPSAPAEDRHGWQAYVTQVDEERAPRPRNAIMEHLQQAGISTRPGTHTVPNLGYYAERYGFTPASFPVATELERTTLALPLHGHMDTDDVARVAKLLCEL